MVFYKIQLEHYLLIFGVIICGIAEKKHGQGMLKCTALFYNLIITLTYGYILMNLNQYMLINVMLITKSTSTY